MKNLEQQITDIIPKERIIGLRGKLGVCIAWFILGEKDEKNPYTVKAQKLLSNITSNFSFDNRLDLLNGLTGFGLGMSFLLKQGYIEGEINFLLRHIDSQIYKVGCQALEMNLQGKEGSGMTDILVYETLRYNELANKWQKECCKRYIIALLNHIYIHRSSTFYEEPMPFTLHWQLPIFLMILSKLIAMDIEPVRVTLILKEMRYYLFSHIPILQPNRLFLYIACSSIAQTLNDFAWEDYAYKLKRSINSETIFTDGLRDKNIFLSDGCIGVYLLQKYHNSYGQFKFDLSVDNLISRINNSSVWKTLEIDEDFLKKHYSLDGYYGVKVFLKYLEEGKL